MDILPVITDQSFTLPSSSLINNNANDFTYNLSSLSQPTISIDDDLEEDHFIQEMERLDALEGKSMSMPQSEPMISPLAGKSFSLLHSDLSNDYMDTLPSSMANDFDDVDTLLVSAEQTIPLPGESLPSSSSLSPSTDTFVCKILAQKRNSF